MKLNKIVIILEPEEGNEQDKTHATSLEWHNNMWTTNGSVYSRLMGELNNIVLMIKGHKPK